MGRSQKWPDLRSPISKIQDIRFVGTDDLIIFRKFHNFPWNIVAVAWWESYFVVGSLDLTWWPDLTWPWAEIFTKVAKKMGGKVGENPAALRAAVFSLSSKNLRGAFKRPPPPAGRGLKGNFLNKSNELTLFFDIFMNYVKFELLQKQLYIQYVLEKMLNFFVRKYCSTLWRPSSENMALHSKIRTRWRFFIPYFVTCWHWLFPQTIHVSNMSSKRLSICFWITLWATNRIYQRHACAVLLQFSACLPSPCLRAVGFLLRLCRDLSTVIETDTFLLCGIYLAWCIK